LDAEAVMDAAAALFAEVLAATASLKFFTSSPSFFLAKSFFFLLPFPYGIQEHNFIFLKSTELIG